MAKIITAEEFKKLSKEELAAFLEGRTIKSAEFDNEGSYEGNISFDDMVLDLDNHDVIHIGPGYHIIHELFCLDKLSEMGLKETCEDTFSWIKYQHSEYLDGTIQED